VDKTINIKNTSRIFSQAARWQVIAIVLVAIASFLFAGVQAASSALIGGACVLTGAYVGLASTRGRNSNNAGAVLITMLKAEAIKVIVIAMLLLVTFKFYKGLVPLALISGLAVAALMAGVGLRTMNNENNEQD
jgi:ATP synthase protein I